MMCACVLAAARRPFVARVCPRRRRGGLCGAHGTAQRCPAVHAREVICVWAAGVSRQARWRGSRLARGPSSENAPADGRFEPLLQQTLAMIALKVISRRPTDVQIHTPSCAIF